MHLMNWICEILGQHPQLKSSKRCHLQYHQSFEWDSTLKVNTRVNTIRLTLGLKLQWLTMNFWKHESWHWTCASSFQEIAILNLVIRIKLGTNMNWTVKTLQAIFCLCPLCRHHVVIITAKMAPRCTIRRTSTSYMHATCQICTNCHFLITAIQFSWQIS